MEITIPIPEPATIVAICILGTLVIFVAYISFVFTRQDDEDRNFILIMVLIAFGAVALFMVALVAAYALGG